VERAEAFLTLPGAAAYTCVWPYEGRGASTALEVALPTSDYRRVALLAGRRHG